jgi:hypothetical protein
MSPSRYGDQNQESQVTIKSYDTVKSKKGPVFSSVSLTGGKTLLDLDKVEDERMKRFKMLNKCMRSTEVSNIFFERESQ